MRKLVFGSSVIPAEGRWRSLSRHLQRAMLKEGDCRVPFSTKSSEPVELTKQPSGLSRDQKTIEAMKAFEAEAVPKILDGLRKLHRERYPEKYPPAA